MVTAAGMLFPWETDNIEITTPLRAQPVTHAPTFLPHILYYAQLPAPFWHRLPCEGKLLELAVLLTAWQVCVIQQLQPTVLQRPAGVFLGNQPPTETWQRALWVKDRGRATGIPIR